MTNLVNRQTTRSAGLLTFEFAAPLLIAGVVAAVWFMYGMRSGLFALAYFAAAIGAAWYQAIKHRNQNDKE